MTPESKLGDIRRDHNGPPPDDEKEFCKRLVSSHSRCPALVLKMIDKTIAVVEGKWRVQGGRWWVDKNLLAQESARGFVPAQVNGEREHALSAGRIGLYTAAEAKEFGLCQRVCDSEDKFLTEYKLSPTSILGDPARIRTAWHFEIRGDVNRAFKESLQRRIPRAIGQGANVIILHLECGDGDTVIAADIARFLRDLKDDGGKQPVRTIAYLTGRTSGAATFLALGCQEIVMGPQAQLGDFQTLVQERPKHAEAVEQALEELLRDRYYPPILAQTMVQPGLTVHLVRAKKGAAESRLISDAELMRDLEGPQKWEVEETIAGGAAGKLFKLDAALAKKLGVAKYVVASPQELYDACGGLKNVKEMGTDWLDEFAAFLRNGWMAVLLVMVGIGCLIIELKMPGVTLPGIIAALCFILYFWAHSQLSGQITMLAVLLFVLGLVLIGLEVFVIPGFGVTGISGILFMVLSLALVTLDKKPETTHEWLAFGKTLSTLGLGLLGAVSGALLVASYLPHIPYVNRLVLRPPGEAEELEDGESDRAHDHYVATAALLGAIGVAVTDLRPAGMARIGDDFVDVVSEGSYIEAGTRVQVIEIEGNRIVVKEV